MHVILLVVGLVGNEELPDTVSLVRVQVSERKRRAGAGW